MILKALRLFFFIKSAYARGKKRIIKIARTRGEKRIIKVGGKIGFKSGNKKIFFRRQKCAYKKSPIFAYGGAVIKMRYARFLLATLIKFTRKFCARAYARRYKNIRFLLGARVRAGRG